MAIPSIFQAPAAEEEQGICEPDGIYKPHTHWLNNLLVEKKKRKKSWWRRIYMMKWREEYKESIIRIVKVFLFIHILEMTSTSEIIVQKTSVNM